MQAEAEAFCALHASDWADCISSKSITSLKLKRLAGPEILPQTSDLVKLKDHVDNTIHFSINELEECYSYSVYRNLLEYVLAALILFNKRRGGEASKLLLSAYIDRRSWRNSSNEEIVGSLSEIEKKLVQR